MNRSYTRVSDEWTKILGPRDSTQYLINGTGTTVLVALMKEDGDPDSSRRLLPLGGTIAQITIPSDSFAYAKADTTVNISQDNPPVLPESIIVTSDVYTPPDGEVKLELNAISDELIKLTERVTNSEIKIEKHWYRYAWFAREITIAQREMQESIASFIFNLFYLQRKILEISMFYEKQKQENKRLEYLIHFYDQTENVKKINREIEDIISHIQMLNGWFWEMKPKTDLLHTNFIKFIQAHQENITNIYKDILNHNRRIFNVEKKAAEQKGINADLMGKIEIATEISFIRSLKQQLDIVLGRLSKLDEGFVDLLHRINDVQEYAAPKFRFEEIVQLVGDNQATLGDLYTHILNHNRRLLSAELFKHSQTKTNTALELKIQEATEIDQIDKLRFSHNQLESKVNGISSSLTGAIANIQDLYHAIDTLETKEQVAQVVQRVLDQGATLGDIYTHILNHNRRLLNAELFKHEQLRTNSRLNLKIQEATEIDQIDKLRNDHSQLDSKVSGIATSLSTTITNIQEILQVLETLETKDNAKEVTDEIVNRILDQSATLGDLYTHILNHNRRLFLTEKELLAFHKAVQSIHFRIDTLLTEFKTFDQSVDIGNLTTRMNNMDDGFATLKGDLTDLAKLIELLNTRVEEANIEKIDMLADNALEQQATTANLFVHALVHSRKILQLEQSIHQQKRSDDALQLQIDEINSDPTVDKLSETTANLSSRISGLDSGYSSLRREVDTINDNLVTLGDQLKDELNSGTQEQINTLTNTLLEQQVHTTNTFRHILSQDKRLFAAERFIMEQKGKNIELQYLVIDTKRDANSKISDIQTSIGPIASSVNSINAKLQQMEPQLQELLENNAVTTPEGVEAMKTDLRSLQGEFSSLNNALNTLAAANTSQELTIAFDNLIKDTTNEQTKQSITAIKNLLLELKEATTINDEQAAAIDTKIGPDKQISIGADSLTDVIGSLEVQE